MPNVSQEEMVAVLQAYQDKLAQAEQDGAVRFDQVFSRPPAGMAVHEFDTTGVIRRVNAEELKILGYAVTQVVGQPVWQFVAMLLVDRRLKDAEGRPRGIRTAMMCLGDEEAAP